MIPKLTDDAISMLPLESGRAELLEEIMTTVAPDRQTEPTPNPHPAPDPLAGARSPPPRSSPVSPAGRVVAAAPPGAGRLEPRGRPLGLPEGQAVVLDAPGWKVDSLGGDGIQVPQRRRQPRDHVVRRQGLRLLRRRTASTSSTRRPPVPRSRCSAGPAQMWAYSPDDHTAIREVEDGHWMEFRGQGMDQAAYLALLGQLRLTSRRGVQRRRCPTTT